MSKRMLNVFATDSVYIKNLKIKSTQNMYIMNLYFMVNDFLYNNIYLNIIAKCSPSKNWHLLIGMRQRMLLSRTAMNLLLLRARCRLQEIENIKKRQKKMGEKMYKIACWRSVWKRTRYFTVTLSASTLSIILHSNRTWFHENNILILNQNKIERVFVNSFS